jgi:hypothetical protein
MSPLRDSSTKDPTDETNGTVESYETDDGVVFFDAQNPLAWVEASLTLRLSECV